MSDAKIQRLRVELVEFQHCQVGVEVIAVLLSLLLDVFLEELEVNRIVAGILQVIRVDERKISNSAYRSMLLSISGIVMVTPSSVLIIFAIFAHKSPLQTELKLIFRENSRNFVDDTKQT